LQALLEGISLSQLQPKIPPELIKLYLQCTVYCYLFDKSCIITACAGAAGGHQPEPAAAWRPTPQADQVVSLEVSKLLLYQQYLNNPTVCMQALLEGISLSQPQPKIPPELIKFLGKAFNAWHIAIPLLESHVIIFPDETRCFDALAELYKLVRAQLFRGAGFCRGWFAG
jgi:hypothetical protein